MSVVLALAFMAGVIALLVGSVRAARAIRPLITSRADDEPTARRLLPGAVWLGIAVYGLVLASAAMLLTA